MLLSTRRSSLIYFCLHAIQAAWFTPFWMLFFDLVESPWLAYGIILAWLLAWTLSLELLSRTEIGEGMFDVTALVLMAATSLLLVRVVVYPGWPLFDFNWTRDAVRQVIGLQSRTPAILGLILGNIFLWQRASSAANRDLSFFAVGVSFRLGLLLMIMGAGGMAFVRQQNLFGLLWLYFALGLTAVAIARIDEKAEEAQSAGRPLPLHRFIQLLAAVGITIGGAALLALAYTPAGIRRFLHLLDPLWKLLKPVAMALLMLVARLLDPLLTWLEGRLAQFLSSRDLSINPLQPFGAGQDQAQGILERLPPWLRVTLIRAGTAAVIVLLAIVLIGILVLYLERARRRTETAEGEEEDKEAITLGGGILGRGLQSIRSALALVHRFGLGRNLLAAISVQNIYANLCRLARQRGFGRPPAQPPDDYLATFQRAFPGHEEILQRITAAYMRVHYGDHPATAAELSDLRQGYHAIRQAEQALRHQAGD